MNDHNLDDLIIDTAEHPKKSKAKGFLTIIALFIVVLIAAIILTRVVLDEGGNTKTPVAEQETEMVSPELTLAQVSKSDKPKSEPKLNEIIEEELNKPVETKHKSLPEELKDVKPAGIPAPIVRPKVKEIVAEESAPVEKTEVDLELPKPEAVTVAETEEKAEKIEIPKPRTVEISNEFSQTVKKEEKPKAKTATHKKTTHTAATGHYYIQVGSYRTGPSKQILRTIKNSGFSHRILSSGGTKKLLIGPYSSRKSASAALVRVRGRINKSAFIVKK